MQNIKAIIFDLGGVILDISVDKTRRAFEQLGVEDFEKMYSLKDANHLFQKLEEGKIDEQEFYDGFRKSSGKNISDDEIKNAWNELLLQFRTGTLAMLEALKMKYKLFLLSNTNIIHRQAFNKIFETQIGKGSLNHFFEKAYFSYEIGCRKPDAGAYEYVLKENNLSPSETLFIDDSLENIEGAKNSGMQVIHLTESMKVEELGLIV
jgi:glucose-1-phosphatase